MNCLDFDTAAAYLAGELDQSDAERWATHVSECATCRDLIREASTLIDDVRRDLRALDAGLEQATPLPIEQILERARPNSPTAIDLVTVTTPTMDRQPDEVSARSRRIGRTTITVAAVTILAVWLTTDSASAAAHRVRELLGRVSASLTALVSAPRRVALPPPAEQAAPLRVEPVETRLPPETPVAPIAPRRLETPKPLTIPPALSSALERDELAAWHQLHLLGLWLGKEGTARRSDRSVEVSLSIGNDTRRSAAEAAFARRFANPPTLHVMPSQPEYDPVGVDTLSPLFNAIRQHFSTTPSATVVAEEYLRSVLTTSTRLRERTASLRQFVSAFPVSRLRALDLDAMAQWRRVVRDHVLEVGATAATLRQHLSMLEGADTAPPSPAIDTLSAVEPALIDFLHLSDAASESLDHATSGRRSADTLTPLVTTLQRLVRDAERFSGPWDFSR